MSNLPSAFKNPQGEALYMAAYEAAMRLWTVPYEAMDIPSRFGSTHLVVSGPEDAPPLVLLHGASASLTMWAFNVPELSQDYRVYALDVMGQPSKSVPDQTISKREDLVEWLTAILDALRIGQTHLVGMSDGGWIALNYAMSMPNRLRKLVVLSPAGGFLPIKKQFFIRAMLATYLPGRFWMNSFIRWMTYKESVPNENNRRMFHCMVDQMYLGVKYFRMPSYIPPVAYRDEELRSIKNPTLLLIGQQEALYDPVGAVERAKRLIPSIKAELIPRANHDMACSQARTVDQKILEFLKE